MKFKRKTSRIEVPSLAMGDIAFNLLIFFVILAKATDDSHIQWQPAKVKELDATQQSKVTVVIDVDEKVHLNGIQIGVGQLAARISELLGNAPTGERIVLLKVDDKAKAITFEPVIEAIGQAGGDLFHIVEKQTANPP